MISLQGADLSYKANPEFDYETQATYTIDIIATDGTLAWTRQVLTVNIQDVVELPTFVNLPADITVEENQHWGAELFYVSTFADRIFEC